MTAEKGFFAGLDPEQREKALAHRGEDSPIGAARAGRSSMSLYNMLFGVNPMAETLLSALGIGRDDVPRFRDCYLTERDGVDCIAVYTRTGGGNRDYYENEDSCRKNYPEYFDDEPPSGPWNEDLRTNEYFLEDEDDDFDCTYATFYYRVPEAFAPIIATLKEIGAGTMEKPGERFAKLIDDLQSRKETPETVRALAVGRTLIEQINSAVDPAPGEAS